MDRHQLCIVAYGEGVEWGASQTPDRIGSNSLDTRNPSLGFCRTALARAPTVLNGDLRDEDATTGKSTAGNSKRNMAPHEEPLRLQWLSGQTRPELAADTSLLQHKDLEFSDLVEAYSTLDYARPSVNAGITIRAVGSPARPGLLISAPGSIKATM